MAPLDDTTIYCLSFEYNPCIRKGKYKPVYKKQKKYEAKSQKMNLICSQRHKLIDETRIDSKSMYNEVINILNKGLYSEWNDNYYYLYTQVYHLDNDKELAKKYQKILIDIQDIELYKLYDDYYEKFYTRGYTGKYW